MVTPTKHFIAQAEFLLRGRVVNGRTSSGPNPAQTRPKPGPNPARTRPEPGPNSKINLKPKSCPKHPKVKLGLKNLVMLPSYFDFIFVHPRHTKEYGTISNNQRAAANRPLFSLLINKWPICQRDRFIEARQTLHYRILRNCLIK